MSSLERIEFFLNLLQLFVQIVELLVVKLGHDRIQIGSILFQVKLECCMWNFECGLVFGADGRAQRPLDVHQLHLNKIELTITTNKKYGYAPVVDWSVSV